MTPVTHGGLSIFKTLAIAIRQVQFKPKSRHWLTLTHIVNVALSN